jgi:hypothetical protein
MLCLDYKQYPLLLLFHFCSVFDLCLHNAVMKIKQDGSDEFLEGIFDTCAEIISTRENCNNKNNYCYFNHVQSDIS